MNKKQWMFPFLSVLLVVALLVGGCGGQKREPAATPSGQDHPAYEWGKFTGKTLTVWGRGTDITRAYLTRAFERYEDLTGNIIKTETFEPEALQKAAASAFQSGTDAPDVLLSFGGTNIDAFHPDKNFYDFSDAPWVDDLTDTSINQTVYNGKIIGLPHWEASISGTIYNKKIFEKLHLQPPKNQQEFLQVCETLKENGVIPLYLTGAAPSMLLYQFPLDILVQDTDTLKGLNDCTIGYGDLPQMRDIVEWYRLMADRGYLGDSYEENDWDGMSEALSSEKYAMMLCWDTWLYTDFQGDASKFGLMPAFMGIPEEGTFEGPNLSLLLVNKNGPQVDVAVDFITFLADPYNYQAAFEGIYMAPVFKQQFTQISTPQYVEAAGWIEQNFHDSTSWLRIKGFSQMDSTCILTYMRGTPGYTVEQCLEDMEAMRQGRLPQSETGTDEERNRWDEKGRSIS